MFDAARAVLQEAAPQPSTNGDAEFSLLKNAKKIALLTLGVTLEKYGAQLEQQQEIVMNFSDIIMEVFAMESSCCAAENYQPPATERTPPTPAPCTCVTPSRESTIRRGPSSAPALRAMNCGEFFLVCTRMPVTIQSTQLLSAARLQDGCWQTSATQSECQSSERPSRDGACPVSAAPLMWP